MNKAVSKKVKKSSDSNNNSIYIKGARVHNLKNVSVEFPRNKLIVVTGVSGSGKSSLTIDTLFAEGQRRYAESLSAYARQFMQRINKPDVDYIKGLCPAIAIEQKVVTRTPRSTVGSMTEIFDYLRLLFSRIGKTISPISGREVKKDDVTDVINSIQDLNAGDKILILVPFKTGANRDVSEELNIILQKGFSRIHLNGKVNQIEDVLSDEKTLEDPVLFDKAYIVIDRIVKKDFDEDDLHRLSDSVGTAFYEGEGIVLIEVNGKKLITFSNKFELDGIKFEEPVPNLFSFNNPFGACPVCEGFSLVLGLDPDLIIPDKSLSVYEGAVAPWKGEKMGLWRENFIRSSKHFDFPIHTPVMDLEERHLKDLWEGNEFVNGINAFFKEVQQNLYKVQYRVMLSRYRGKTQCEECEGFRLRKEALYVKINGLHIGQISKMPVKELPSFFDSLELSEFDKKVSSRLLQELKNRVQTLLDVGLGYLTLDRLANSLSGGESQRIQLTRSLGSNLTNSLYILDEPSIGLHSRDTERLIKVLKQLRDLGNTVVVVEHDELIMKEADHIIDMGPLASHLGGEVIAEGNFSAIVNDEDSLTGKYLSGEYSINPPAKVRKWNNYISVEGARENNLKNINVTFPLNVFCAVSGVSGSGKTTLVKQILAPAIKRHLGDFSEKAGLHKAIKGDIGSIKQIEMVDQNPIGKSSRSNPVTYIKAYDEIRELFAGLPLSKMRGFQPKHFSFNVDGGRCDACKGEGEQVVEMQFLADVHLVCDVCNGKKFKDEVLEVKYRGKSIYDFLEMGIDEAIEFLIEDEKNIDAKCVAEKLQPLSDVGLGYIKLGQSATTLSGGEAQRVKLASFLTKGRSGGSVLFIFDEPTTGLHFHDIKKLLKSFNALIENGHSVLVIEHNTDVLKSADWIIDLGPEAGEAGGNLVFEGTPANLKKCKGSITAKFL
ncbi:MAG: excinuclease ABC subunit UvrA [Bacteroidetes bacterium]|nr:excinuclease ABC subunit UvrA [Bacteroidota bacterium]